MLTVATGRDRGWNGIVADEVMHKDAIAVAADKGITPALDAAHLASCARAWRRSARLRRALHGLDADVWAEEPAADERWGVISQRRIPTELWPSIRNGSWPGGTRAHRMDEGTYGLSEVSGRPIPLERLEALPWATTAVDDPAQP